MSERLARVAGEQRALGVLALAAVTAIVWLSWPFTISLLLGALLAFTLDPIYQRLVKGSGRPLFAALTMVMASGLAGAGDRGCLRHAVRDAVRRSRQHHRRRVAARWVVRSWPELGDPLAGGARAQHGEPHRAPAVGCRRDRVDISGHRWFDRRRHVSRRPWSVFCAPGDVCGVALLAPHGCCHSGRVSSASGPHPRRFGRVRARRKGHVGRHCHHWTRARHPRGDWLLDVRNAAASVLRRGDSGCFADARHRHC
jgi:hypothetical protein